MRKKLLKRLTGVTGIIIFIIFIALVSIIFLQRFGDIVENPAAVRDTVLAYGMWGYLIFSLFNIFQIIFAPVPGHVVTVSSGILFGFLRGTLVTWVSVVIGGSIVMCIARYFGRKMLDFLLDEKAKKFEADVTRKGIPFILLLSIFPNPLGDGLFYLAGITRVPLKVLIPLIAAGRLPGIIISVLFGDWLLAAGVLGWIIGIAGFLIAVILYMIFGKKIENVFVRLMDWRIDEKENKK
ncbi:MAG: TVP38/TMEM64 family protein [candidate division WOR-3 bacterium]|nr:MAG: TVP38/TMEM64 family protein [candidate division WOR-3 bacterium]